jgi:hypothetical protein
VINHAASHFTGLLVMQTMGTEHPQPAATRIYPSAPGTIHTYSLREKSRCGAIRWER